MSRERRDALMSLARWNIAAAEAYGVEPGKRGVLDAPAVAEQELHLAQTVLKEAIARGDGPAVLGALKAIRELDLSSAGTAAVSYQREVADMEHKLSARMRWARYVETLEEYDNAQAVLQAAGKTDSPDLRRDAVLRMLAVDVAELDEAWHATEDEARALTPWPRVLDQFAKLQALAVESGWLPAKQRRPVWIGDGRVRGRAIEELV